MEKKTGSYSKRLRNGESIENTIFDARGKVVEIIMESGSTLRNVAIINDNGHPGPIKIKAQDGGNVLLKNVFVNNVADNCVFVHEKHSGHARIEECYFGNAVEDAVYASPCGNPDYKSGKAPGGRLGTVEIIRSVAENCKDYGFRLGSEGSKVVDSVVKNCGTGLANLYALGEGATFRNVDVTANNIGVKHIDHDDRNVGRWPEEVVTNIENVRVDAPDVVKRFSTASGSGTINGHPSGDPDVSFPDSVPKSAQEAANGESSDGGSSGPRGGRKLTIDGSETSEQVRYEFEGHASKVEMGKYANPNSGDEKTGERTGKGQVHSGVDTWKVFSNEEPHITSLVLKNASKEELEKVKIFLDGKDVTSIAVLEPEEPEEPVKEEASGPRSVPKDAVLVKVVADEANSESMMYSLETNGSFFQGSGYSGKDNISSNEASGEVWPGFTDSYWMSGTLADFELSNSAEIVVDGVTLPDTLIHFSGDGGYEFEVEEEVYKSEEKLEGISGNVSANGNDEIDGKKVSGRVSGGIDAYRLKGSLASVKIDRDVRVFIDREEATDEYADSLEDLKQKLADLGLNSKEVELEDRKIVIAYA